MTTLSTSRLDCDVLLIHRRTLKAVGQRDAFMAACRELEAAVAAQEYSLWVKLWIYGPSPNEPLQVTHILGLSSLASHGPWIKSKAWKQFLKATRPLVEPPGPESSKVTVLADTAGVVVPSAG